ncbi:MAG: hypothetical protein PHQ59_00080 [Candidatus Daviesbacteria bacterium]|nr:hypothetical protein [Candidatus Daviesbacteria bacterium]
MKKINKKVILFFTILPIFSLLIFISKEDYWRPIINLVINQPTQSVPQRAGDSLNCFSKNVDKASSDKSQNIVFEKSENPADCLFVGCGGFF